LFTSLRKGRDDMGGGEVRKKKGDKGEGIEG